MARELAALDDASEESYALEFEEPGFITLGICYEERPRFSGGAYNPVLNAWDKFLKEPLKARSKSAPRAPRRSWRSTIWSWRRSRRSKPAA
jgi:hypothetical protein